MNVMYFYMSSIPSNFTDFLKRNIVKTFISIFEMVIWSMKGYELHNHYEKLF